MIITLDGPTASGKSAIAYRLANNLSFMYINTGLLYRAFAYALVHECEYGDEQLKDPAHDDIRFVLEADVITYGYTAHEGAHIRYRGHDVTRNLKLPDVDRWASITSARPAVRQALLELQRRLAHNKDVVAEGRDCGTVVFPYAEHKFFLTARDDVRAKRWYDDQIRRGVKLTMDDALASLKERDTRDSTRAVAPLVVPKNAIVIDNSELDLNQTIEAIVGHIKQPAPR